MLDSIAISKRFELPLSNLNRILQKIYGSNNFTRKYKLKIFHSTLGHWLAVNINVVNTLDQAFK